jgi:hypothetical protein
MRIDKLEEVEVLAVVLEDMQAAGLINLRPDKEISLAPVEDRVEEMPAMSGTIQPLWSRMSKNAA